MYVFMIGKGQIALKYWSENRLESKFKGKYMYLIVF